MTLAGPSGSNSYCGHAAAAAGDLNDDGFGDVVVGCLGGGTGFVHTYHGSATGPSASATTSVRGAVGAGARFGWAVY